MSRFESYQTGRGSNTAWTWEHQALSRARVCVGSALLDNVGNIALLKRAQAAGLLPLEMAQAAADAYRDLRRMQHRARLNEQSTQVAPERVAAHRLAVQTLWCFVFIDSEAVGGT